MKKHFFLPILLLAFGIMTTGCSKDEMNYDGTWSGSTSQGKIISFTVSGNSVKNVYIGYSLSGTCYQSPVASQLYSSYAINGNSFSITGNIDISGSFSSPGKAGGSFSVDVTGNPPGCNSSASGTWSTSK